MPARHLDPMKPTFELRNDGERKKHEATYLGMSPIRGGRYFRAPTSPHTLQAETLKILD